MWKLFAAGMVLTIASREDANPSWITAATQHAERAENEKREAIAKAAKAVEIARGQAQANDLPTKSLTPAPVQWKQLEILDEKWNGQFPRSSGESRGAAPSNADEAGKGQALRPGSFLL